MRAAVISGYGLLPLLSVRALKEEGNYVIAVALSESCNYIKELKEEADALYESSAGQVGKILKILKKEKITRAMLIGKVEISLLEKGIRLDFTALWEIAKLAFRSTDSISMAAVNVLEKRGISILSQREVLKNYMPSEKIFSQKKPDEETMKTIYFGFNTAKSIGKLDLGQSAVAAYINGENKIMAIESAEGTDKTFARGCLLAEGKGVAVKTAKPFQDARFDIPTAGIDTLKNVAENGGKAFIFEADETIIVDLPACIKYADEKNMIFGSVKI